MHGFVIGDTDMVTGFRLVGVEGEEALSIEDARLAFQKALTRKDLALIILSEEFSTQMREEIDKVRTEQVRPLIVEIPGRNGPSGEVKMSDFISKTLGVRV